MPLIDTAIAQRIRVVGLDVDGVLTDGGIYLGDSGSTRVELKRYDIQDGVGIHILRKSGIIPVIVTGRVSESVRLRAQELGIEDVAQDANAMKLPAFRSMLARHGVSPDEAAFIGDDLPDLAVLRHVCLPVAVGNATAEVRAICRLQLSCTGGHGAVREFVELLLKARGEWSALVDRYVAERMPEEAEAAR